MNPLRQVGDQKAANETPWSSSQRIGILLWHFAWPLLCGWTPKPLNRWRLFVLRRFGTKIHGRPFVHQRARIQIPWNLTLHNRATLGDRANVYSLAPVEIAAHATIAQEAYLCTGTHDFERSTLNLLVGEIEIGEYAFVGARAFVMPGVKIGDRAVIGACSVVTRDVDDGAIVAGNPARKLGQRSAGG